MRSEIREDTEETADVACTLARVVVTGGRVIGDESSPPVMMGSLILMPDSIMTEVTISIVALGGIGFLVALPSFVERTDVGSLELDELPG